MGTSGILARGRQTYRGSSSLPSPGEIPNAIDLAVRSIERSSATLNSSDHVALPLLNNIRSWSLLALFLLWCFIGSMRIDQLSTDELSWDVFGYYLYLPATFIHHDPLLHDTTWVHAAWQNYHVSGTLYQLSTAPDNSTPMYFFLMGMSLCYAPFFFIGHAIALATGQSPDGFSAPYQYAIAIGSLAYAFVGLWCLRRTLLRFFSDSITAVVLVVLVVGTNYAHFSTTKNLETANFLFCWVSLLLWNTLRWHESPRAWRMAAIAVCVAMITLIKPSEVVCALLPLAWGVHDRASLRTKLRMLGDRWRHVVLAVMIGLLLLLPQLLYWKTLSGHFVYDTYKNPGVGLDLGKPHFLQVLFSFRKGWLIYTPVMLFSVLGLVPLYRTRRDVFWPVALYCGTAFYVISSWSEWWYGASFSIRPMVSLYPALSIPLGFSFMRVMRFRPSGRWLAMSIVVLLCLLNQFQLWQLRHYVLDPYRTTAAYYRAIFGRTTVPSGASDLLLVARSFDGAAHLTDEWKYRRRTIGLVDLEEAGDAPAERVLMDSVLHTHVLVLDSAYNFSPSIELPFVGVTGKDHFWARGSARVFIPRDYAGELPCLVMTMERKEGSYGYRTACLPDTIARGQWLELRLEYLTPEIRDEADRFKAYVWHRGKNPILVDDLRVSAFVPED